ncbi:unnamed protein product [Durusdinium trenchii]|uniref:Potassium channel tetramerisation-type BTB domain-containing protein n=1 Tax=Durusdinium trenchii TaxID=1381693 RepID=A0ABP0P145_9DINO
MDSTRRGVTRSRSPRDTVSAGRHQSHEQSDSPVKINIGGEKLIEVYPDLFAVRGENKLTSIMAGRWRQPRDAQGNIFVDYSPEVFMPLVEWLRECRDADPQNELVPVRIDQEQHGRRMAWVRMMRALSFAWEDLVFAAVTAQEFIEAKFPARVCLQARAGSLPLAEALFLDGVRQQDFADVGIQFYKEDFNLVQEFQDYYETGDHQPRAPVDVEVAFQYICAAVEDFRERHQGVPLALIPSAPPWK